MAIIVPNAASIYGADASMPHSANHWIWLGFQPNAGASGGSVWFYTGSAPSAGSALLPIIVASANRPVMFGPFNSPCGFCAASTTTGSSILWMKTAS